MPSTMSCPACQATIRITDDAQASLSCPGCNKTFKRRAKPATMDGRSAPPPVPVAVGGPATVGRFQVRRRLGAGAFGTVYLAHDPQLDRDVALKVPNPGTLTTPRRVERFLREARAAANLRHPNIVPLFEAGRLDDGTYYIASAFIDGEPLADAIPEGGLPARDAAKVVRALAEALAYAHDQGIVHRDVKPANVLIDKSGAPHLMDFGLASRLDESEKLTQDGAVLGTPAYMAPEQAEGQKGDARPASDQYSLGVLLYELLTGGTPFSGPPAAVLAQVLSQDPEPPRQRRPGLDRDLETVCLKCLEKDPRKRYADCGELADDLRRWLEGEPIHARRLGLAERAVRWVGKNKAVAALTAAVALTLLVGVIVAGSFAVIAAANAAAAQQETARADEKAKEAADRAQEAAARAQEARDEAAAARRAEAVAKAETAKANKARFAIQVEQASRAWEDRDIAAARRVLGQIPTDFQQTWEVRFLGGLLDRTARRIDASFGSGGTLDYRRDGRLLASVYAGSLRLWDPAGKAVPLPAGCPPRAWSAAFAPDDARLAVGFDQQVIVWDLASGRQLHTLAGHTGAVHALAFAPDGAALATGCADTTVRVWDRNGQQTATRKVKRSRQVGAVAFSPDGKTLAALDGIRDSGDTAAIHRWDAASGEEHPVLSVRLFSGVAGIRFSPDSKHLAAASSATVTVFDLAGGAPVTFSASATGGVNDLRFTPDGKSLVTASTDKTVRLWDPRTGQLQRTYRGHTAAVHGVAISPDGKRLFSGGQDLVHQVWDLAVTQAGGLPPVVASAQPAVAWLPDSRTVACAVGQGQFVVADPFTGEVKGRGKASPLGVSAIACTPDGKRLITASQNAQVTIWDARTLREELALPIDPPAAITSMAVDRASRTLLIGHVGKTARLWDLEGGRQIHLLDGHDNNASAVALSPDGQVAATSTLNGATRLWDVATGQERLRVATTKRVLGLAFSPDGALLASGGGQQRDSAELKLWDARTGQLVRTLEGHADQVTAVAFTPDGSTLVTTSGDFTTRRWDVETGLELMTLAGHTNEVRALAISPDGESVLSVAVGPNGARLWSTRPVTPP